MSEDKKNELVRYHTTQELMGMAKIFAESGMFADTRQAAQAFVKIQAGAEMGIMPFAAMAGVHIIKGKPSIGAGIMASRVKASGKYDYRVVQQDDKSCVIDFYQGKDCIGRSSFTIEDARKAGTQNLEKFARNMLFARAISNGVKWYCPDVFSCTVYTPEELSSTGAETVQDAEFSAEPPAAANDDPPAPATTLVPAFNERSARDDELPEFFLIFTRQAPHLTTYLKRKFDTMSSEDLADLMQSLGMLESISKRPESRQWLKHYFTVVSRLMDERAVGAQKVG